MGGRYGNKEENEQIIECFKLGLSNKEIALQMERSETFVRRRIEKYLDDGGLFLPKGEYDEELTQYIISKYLEGYSINRIAINMGRSFCYVSKRVEDYLDNLEIQALKGGKDK